jgi:hypothetical protein
VETIDVCNVVLEWYLQLPLTCLLLLLQRDEWEEQIEQEDEDDVEDAKYDSNAPSGELFQTKPKTISELIWG